MFDIAGVVGVGRPHRENAHAQHHERADTRSRCPRRAAR